MLREAKATSRDLREGPRRQQPLPSHPAVMMVQKVVISWCCQKGWLAKQLKRVSCLPPVHVPARIPSVCCPYCPCPVLQFAPAALQVHPISPRTSLRASNKKPLELQPPSRATPCSTGTAIVGTNPDGTRLPGCLADMELPVLVPNRQLKGEGTVLGHEERPPRLPWACGAQLQET